MNVIEDFWGDIKIKFHHLYSFLLSGGIQESMLTKKKFGTYFKRTRPLNKIKNWTCRAFFI